jgi:hypothetical protein
VLDDPGSPGNVDVNGTITLDNGGDGNKQLDKLKQRPGLPPINPYKVPNDMNNTQISGSYYSYLSSNNQKNQKDQDKGPGLPKLNNMNKGNY